MIINPERLSVAELLHRFEQDMSQPPYRSKHGRTIRAMLWQRHGDFSDAQVDSLLAGLEKLALEGSDPSLRVLSISYLARAGFPEARKPRRDIAERMGRIYERSSHEDVHRTVLENVERVVGRAETIRFLRRIALQSPQERAFPQAPGYAISALARMEEDGRAVLQALHRQNLIRDPIVRRFLDEYAARGFRPPQPD